MSVTATLPPRTRQVDEDAAGADDVDWFEVDDEELDPLELDDFEDSLPEDDVELSLLVPDEPSDDELDAAAVRDDEPRLSVL
jgi:hypothetical protein